MSEQEDPHAGHPYARAMCVACEGNDGLTDPERDELARQYRESGPGRPASAEEIDAVQGWLRNKRAAPLPTSPGALIRWSIRIDATEHYGAALLDYDEDRPVWYMAGFDREHTPAELHTLLLGRDWHEVTR